MTDEEMQVHTDSVLVGSNATQGRFELTPLLTYYGIVDRDMNYPYRTSDGVAFDTLSLEGIDQQHLPANSSMNATVTEFIPRVKCDRADVNASITSAPTSEGPQGILQCFLGI
jgi:hypothetical protein